MKKSVSILAVLLAIACFPFGPTLAHSPLSHSFTSFDGDTKPGEGITVILKLACKKKDCSGVCLSICDIIIVEERKLSMMTFSKVNEGAGFFESTGAGGLRLTLLKKQWGPDFQSNYLKNGQFELEESYTLSPDINAALGFSEAFTILNGKYPVNEEADRYVIEF